MFSAGHFLVISGGYDHNGFAAALYALWFAFESAVYECAQLRFCFAQVPRIGHKGSPLTTLVSSLPQVWQQV
jgi:hypothetical protein